MIGDKEGDDAEAEGGVVVEKKGSLGISGRSSVLRQRRNSCFLRTTTGPSSSVTARAGGTTSPSA